MGIYRLPSVYADVVNFIKQTPPTIDSETALARHIAEACNVVTERLGLSTEPLLSTEGFLWSYCSTQGIWARVELPTLISLAQLYDGNLTHPESGKPKRINVSWQKAGNISRSIERLYDLQAPKFFEAPTPGVAFTNGFCTVDNFAVELQDHSAEHAATVAYDFDLDEEAEPPLKWLEFLNTLWENDEDKHNKIKVLQEFIGASIANIVTTYQKCLLCVGQGSNGKSMLSSMIAELLFPEGTTTYVSPRRWDRDYSLASLKDSRINLVSELPETSVLEQTDVFKAVIAGDLIEARLPYQPPFYLRPSAGHIFSANEIPRTKDTSFGFYRRFLFLLFNENFEESPFRKTKAEIKAELLPERSSIILWALHGASRLIRQGDYTRLDSHEETVQEWRKDSDAVFDFALTCLEHSTKNTTPLKDLREAYKDWARRVGRCEEIGARTLSKRLSKVKGLDKKRVSTGMAFGCVIKPIREWDESVN